jgi:hypothetical protein
VTFISPLAPKPISFPAKTKARHLFHQQYRESPTLNPTTVTVFPKKISCVIYSCHKMDDHLPVLPKLGVGGRCDGFFFPISIVPMEDQAIPEHNKWKVLK